MVKTMAYNIFQYRIMALRLTVNQVIGVRVPVLERFIALWCSGSTIEFGSISSSSILLGAD